MLNTSSLLLGTSGRLIGSFDCTLQHGPFEMGIAISGGTCCREMPDQGIAQAYRQAQAVNYLIGLWASWCVMRYDDTVMMQ